MTLIRDCACFALCWAAYKAYTTLPWPMVRGKFGLSLLPYAGMYAYSDTWTDFRLTVQWNVDGRPRSHPYIDHLESKP